MTNESLQEVLWSTVHHSDNGLEVTLSENDQPGECPCHTRKPVARLEGRGAGQDTKGPLINRNPCCT